jgi:hypothetical protein
MYFFNYLVTVEYIGCELTIYQSTKKKNLFRSFMLPVPVQELFVPLLPLLDLFGQDLRPEKKGNVHWLFSLLVQVKIRGFSSLKNLNKIRNIYFYCAYLMKIYIVYSLWHSV